MSSSEVQIVAIINASADKMPTLEEAVRDLCQKVHENEAGVIACQATTEKKKDGSGSVIFFERYKDRAAFTAHSQTPHFKEFGRRAQKEGLMLAPPVIKQCRPLGGFLARL